MSPSVSASWGSARDTLEDRDDAMIANGIGASRRWVRVWGIGVASAVGLVGAQAQSPPVIDGPPMPAAPEVITRNATGQATVRAIKLTAPLKVDGRLDED